MPPKTPRQPYIPVFKGFMASFLSTFMTTELATWQQKITNTLSFAETFGGINVVSPKTLWRVLIRI